MRDLNQKLEDIRREQQYQREREADYRNLSEATNGRAVWYSVAQIMVLILTCAWQLRHLKVSTQVFHTHFSVVLMSNICSVSSKIGKCGSVIYNNDRLCFHFHFILWDYEELSSLSKIFFPWLCAVLKMSLILAVASSSDS